ncbi:MAG: carboxylate-amine ligase, partial [Gemmataceae bacterium]
DWFLRDVIDELGTREQIEYAYKIMEGGSSADRQLKTFGSTGSTRAVVDQLVHETQEGLA